MSRLLDFVQRHTNRKWVVRVIAVVSALIGPFAFIHYVLVMHGAELVSEYKRIWHWLKTGMLE